MHDCAYSDSIFATIKRMIGPSVDTSEFDGDIIVHVNSVLGILNQLGVGPSDGFVITGETETWGDFLGSDKRFEMVKTFVYLKTKIVFDPPTSSILMQAFERQIAEYEWRICNQNESSEGGV